MYLIELYLSPINIPMIYITITPLVCNSKAANIICLIVSPRLISKKMVADIFNSPLIYGVTWKIISAGLD